MDYLVLAPPVCTPAEPPSGAFLLAAGLQGHGYHAGLLDLSLAFYHRVLNDPLIPGPPTLTAVDYLLNTKHGYEPMQHRSALGILHKRLKGFAHLYPGWRLTLMDLAFPGRVHNPRAIATYLEEGKSPFTELFQDTIDPILAKHKPRHVLVSLAYLSQLVAAIDLLRFLDARGINAVVGGSLPTSLALTGHGIEALKDVFPRIETGDGLSLISGAKDAHMLDRLAWPTLLNTQPYLSSRPIVPLALSTGCFWRRCLFCPDRELPFVKIPPRAIAHFFDTMPKSIKSQKPVVHLVDSAIPPTQLREFLPLTEQHNIGFYGFARPQQQLLKPGLLEEAAQKGCKMLQLGVESGSKCLMDRFDKGLDPSEAEQVIQRAADVGIRTYLYLLFGLPGETDADREATQRLAARNADSIDFLNLSLFNLPRFCELSNRRQEFDIVTEDFPVDDSIRLYWPFTCNNASPRNAARHFLEKSFEPHQGIHNAILRTPRWLRAAHLALMKLDKRVAP